MTGNFNINKELLDAMRIIARQEIEKCNRDITKTARVINVNNDKTVKIEMDGKQYDNIPNYNGTTLSVNNIIKVTYPQGQASNMYVSGGGEDEIYSYNEIICGTWVNNKLIYRKVFFFNQSEVQTIGNSFNHNIVGIDEVVSCYGHAISNAGDDFISRWLPFAYTLGTESLPAWYGAVMAGKNIVKIQLGSSMLSRLTKLYIIIEYTKL